MTSKTAEEILNELTEKDGKKLVLKDNGRRAALAGGPDYFASIVTGNSPGPNRKPIARDTAESMVSGWTVVGFKDAEDGFTPPDWVRDFPTTTYRGPQLYPVPEDWFLSHPEGGTLGWKRYEDAENGQEAGTSYDIDDEVLRNDPTDVAVLLSEWTEHEETVWSLSFNHQETIFEDLVVENHNELLTVTAETLAKYARGEPYDDVSIASAKPPKPIREERERQRELQRKKEENKSLNAFLDGDDD